MTSIVISSVNVLESVVSAEEDSEGSSEFVLTMELTSSVDIVSVEDKVSVDSAMEVSKSVVMLKVELLNVSSVEVNVSDDSERIVVDIASIVEVSVISEVNSSAPDVVMISLVVNVIVSSSVLVLIVDSSDDSIERVVVSVISVISDDSMLVESVSVEVKKVVSEDVSSTVL